MIERVDEWESRCAVKSPAVIKGSCDSHGRLVDIWNAEIYFSHDCDIPIVVEEPRSVMGGKYESKAASWAL